MSPQDQNNDIKWENDMMNSPSSSVEFPKDHLLLKEKIRLFEDALLRSSNDSIDIKSKNFLSIFYIKLIF